MRTRNRLAPAILLAFLAACSSSTNGTGAGSAGAPSGPASSESPASRSTGPATSTGSAPSTAVSSAAGLGATSSSAPSSVGPSTHPVPAQPIRTATAVGPTDKTSYDISVWAQDETTDCAGNAYGTPVINYLKTHGCRGIGRLLATTRVNGRAVGFAQSNTSFAGKTLAQTYAYAGDFRMLVTKDGTGNIDDLFRDGYRLPSGPTSVPSPDAFSALAQDDTVTVVEAWYLDDPTPDNDPALVKMAQDIYLQF